MSAYLLDANEIAVVAKICRNYVAADSDVWNHVAKKIVDRNEFEMVLALENIASLEARYPNNGIAGGFICGGQAGLFQYYNEVGKQCEQRADVKIPKNLDDRVAELNRYEYQACEREDFYSSDAYWVIARAKEAILREYVKMQNNGQVEVAA
jgi:hypothetical protein